MKVCEIPAISASHTALWTLCYQDDYYAEMIKSDGHMTKVCARTHPQCSLCAWLAAGQRPGEQQAE